MKKLILPKIKESIMSITPVSLIVLILTFIPAFGFTWQERIIFFICMIFLIIGITLFNIGADIAMQPMGEKIGSSLMKTKKIWLIVIVSFIMGVLITVAEPDLAVLGEQVSTVFGSKMIIIYFVGIGVGLFLAFAILKIIFKKDLSMMLMLFYLVVFALTSLLIMNGNSNLLSLSFDSGGVTTGPITVPFLMAMGVGVAGIIGGRDQRENSFGLVALCSIGPVIAVLLLSVFANNGNPVMDNDYGFSTNIWSTIWHTLLQTALDVGIALGLISVVFLIINFAFIHLSRQRLFKIFLGLVYTYFGLVNFLTAVHIGYMPTGYKLGIEMAKLHPSFVIGFALIIGCVVVLAEPAIIILTRQVEEITVGAVTKKSMLIALSIGVGISICLSIVRIIFKFSLLYYLVPGYIIAIGLSLFVPKLYTSIAFDSGGVASGPLTSSFILPFAIGVCATLNGNNMILDYAFGVVAMVAMTPLIAIQLLGFRSIVARGIAKKRRIKKLENVDDEIIIKF